MVACRPRTARALQTNTLALVLTMLYLDTARRPQRIHLPAHGATTMIATRDRGGHHSDTTRCRSTYDLRISSPLWSVVASAHSRCGQRGSGSVGSIVQFWLPIRQRGYNLCGDNGFTPGRPVGLVVGRS